MKDDERSGRPTTSRTDDNIAAVDKIVKEDRKREVSVNSRYTRHPENCGSTDFKRRFKETKLCSRYVPHALTRKQMDERVAACQDLLNMINDDKNYLDKVITDDESWFFRVRSRNKASELRMGWRTFSTTEETALPKIKSEDDALSVF